MSSYQTLISAQELKQFFHSGRDFCLFDCRFDLADTDSGHKAWLKGHIKHAIYAHLDEQLSGKIIPGVTGRHPLPERDIFVRWLESHGVEDHTQILAYDASGGAFASRLWWLCRWIGHIHCAILDGGIQSWTKSESLVQDDPVSPKRGSLSERQSLAPVVSTEAVQSEDKLLLIDARERHRYRGEEEPIDPVAGHIPGAICMPFPENLDNNGEFLGRDRLKERFYPVLQDSTQRRPVMYCGSGVTAAHNVLAMTTAGLPTPALYADSWSAWIVDRDRPVATGDE